MSKRLPQCEDVGSGEREGQRSHSDAEHGRVVPDEEEREADAKEESREDEQDVHALDGSRAATGESAP
jgi:hypothetical protein